MSERDQPEFCDDCPLGEECGIKGECAAFDILYPVGEIGLEERLECANDFIDNFTQIFVNAPPVSVVDALGFTLSSMKILKGIVFVPSKQSERSQTANVDKEERTDDS